MIQFWKGAISAFALIFAAGGAQADAGRTPVGAASTMVRQTGESTPPTVEKKYCVRDIVTGSRLPKSVCKTRKQWLDTGFDPLAPDQ